MMAISRGIMEMVGYIDTSIVCVTSCDQEMEEELAKMRLNYWQKSPSRKNLGLVFRSFR